VCGGQQVRSTVTSGSNTMTLLQDLGPCSADPPAWPALSHACVLSINGLP
jgi:hypothetical protein